MSNAESRRPKSELWRAVIPNWGDAFVACLVIMMAWNGTTHPEGLAGREAFLFVGACAAVAIAFRRRFPLACVGLIAALMVLHTVLFTQVSLVAVVATLVAVWTSQSRIDPPWRRLFLIGFLIGSELAVLKGLTQLLEPRRPMDYVILMVSTALAVSVAALGGARRRSTRDRQQLTRERLEMLEAQRDAYTRLALAEERTRLAEELHDLLGHTLAAISVQAEGARCVLAASPERADEALETIGRISRDGVDQLHALVDSLHGAEPRPGAADRIGAVPVAIGESADLAITADSLVSAPSYSPALSSSFGASCSSSDEDADMWSDLIALVKRSGVECDADLRLNGYSPLAIEREEAILKNCQEALTNALKHGRPGTTRLAATQDAHEVRLRIENRISDRPKEKRASIGLEMMRRRAREAGIDMSIEECDGIWRVEMAAPHE